MTPDSITAEQAERFFSRFTRAEGCWEWQGHPDEDGYGQMRIGKRRVAKAHRISWMIHKGIVPDGLCVLHRCDNPPCVNPDHLFLGTSTDNNKDRDSKGRGNAPKGERVRSAKLTNMTAAQILQDFIPGTTTEAHLAKKYGVTQGAINSLLRGRSWKHLNVPLPQFTFTDTRARGERSGQAKLTENQVKEIRRMYATGNYSQQFIANKFGVRQTLISNIVLRLSWRHVR